MNVHHRESRAKVFILSCVLWIAGIGIYAARGLYADGSFFLYEILSQKGYWVFDQPRAFVQIITQTPVVLGLKAGLRDITALIYLHSFGLIGIPAIIWFFALAQHVHSERFWLLLIAFSATSLSSGFFAIGEYNLTYALAAYCCSVFTKEKITDRDSCFVLIAALTLTRSYEAMIFLGPALFVFAALRLIHPPATANTYERLLLLVLLFLFAVSATLSAWSILFPRDPANMADAGRIAQRVQSGYFVFLASMISSYFVMQWIPRKARVSLLLMSVVWAAFFVTNRQLWNTPGMNYGFRLMSGFFLFSIFVAALGSELNKTYGWMKTPASANGVRLDGMVAFTLFLALGFASVMDALNFSRWIKTFEIEARNATRWIPVDQIKSLDPSGADPDFGWAWTHPSLSMVLRGDGGGGVLNSTAYTDWQPFMPEALSENPLRSFSKKGELHIIQK